MLNKKGELKQERYRGVNLYDLFTEIGIKSNAGNVIVHAADGSKTELSLALVKKSYENFADASKPALYAMLAYGQGDAAAAADSKGAPLTSETGGPIKLVVPMETAESANSGLCVKNVTAIEVTANKIETWGHSMSDIYAEFLPYTMTLTVKNDTQEKSIDITVEELEKLEGMIVRDTYSVLDIGTCEGIDLWKLVEISAAGTENLNNPVSVTVYASDGYKNDLLSVFYMDGLTKGVVDGNGDRKKLIIAYAFNGYPLVDEETHEGYTGIAGNTSGPLRIVAETVQGASVKYFAKLVVTLPGSGNIELSLK